MRNSWAATQCQQPVSSIEAKPESYLERIGHCPFFVLNLVLPMAAVCCRSTAANLKAHLLAKDLKLTDAGGACFHYAVIEASCSCDQALFQNTV